MAVKQKIRSQRGATLMAALLFFLVAAVCGSIILAAATATLSRVKNQAKDAQAYYAVTSAAQLIRDDLMDSEWEIELTEEYDVDSSSPKTTTVTNVRLIKPTTSSFVSDFRADTVKDNIFVNTDDITITTSINDMPAVYAKVKNEDIEKMKLNQADRILKLTISLTNYGVQDGAIYRGEFNSYQEKDGDGNQLYWVSVELHSVRIPALESVVSDSRVNGKGIVVRKIGMTWADPVIKKVER